VKEITLKNKKYLLVEVPDDAENFTLEDNDGITYDSFSEEIKTGKPWGFIDLEKSSYEIVGTISNILKAEDICKGLVENFTMYVGSQRLQKLGAVDKLVYNNYIDEQVPKSKATDSFLSYLQSINLNLSKSWLLIQKL